MSKLGIHWWVRFLSSLVALLGSLFVLSHFVYARPRPVRLLEEIRDAKTVAEVRIEAYFKNLLVGRNLKSNSRISFKYSSDPQWNPSRFIVQDLHAAGTAEWPPVGSEVIVVVDHHNVVSLFARREIGMWRFWSPMFTGSTAAFECKSPALPLEGAVPAINDFIWDGCLVPEQAVKNWLK